MQLSYVCSCLEEVLFSHFFKLGLFYYTRLFFLSVAVIAKSVEEGLSC